MKKTIKLGNWWLYGIILLLSIVVVGLLWAGRSPLQETITSVTSGNANVTGTLKLSVCSGAQPNYPEPASCYESTAHNTTVYITRNGQTLQATTTDMNGNYSFEIEPGSYVLRVKDESSSEGHPVKLKSGNNELNFTVTQHQP